MNPITSIFKTISLFFLLPIIFATSIYFLYKYGYQIYFEYKVEREFRKSTEPYRQMYKDAIEYSKKAKAIEQKYTQMLKNDTYGGKTPEETLKLFVDALKKKDYKLAAKYYLPWEWENREQFTYEWITKHKEGLTRFIRAVENGIMDTEFNEKRTGVTIFLYPPKDDAAFWIEMRLNPYSNKWKISHH